MMRQATCASAAARSERITLVSKLSPTQLSLYKGCRRKWFYSYPAGFKAPQTASQIVGTEIHAEIETAFMTGKPPESERARCALAVVDDGFDMDKDPIGVELDISLPLPGGHTFVGVIDLYDERDPG